MPDSSPDITTEPAPADLVVDKTPDVSTPAEPSAAESKGAEASPPSLIDSVREALGDKAKKEGSPDSVKDPDATSKATDADGKEPAAETELGELTEDELKRYAPKTQRRILSLLGQRGEYEKRAVAAEAKAQISEKIENFANQNGLSGEDVEGLLEIGALVRGDPFKAIERLTPIYSELLKRTGHVLPEPMQQRVQQGYLTEEDARKLVQAETRATLSEEQRKADAKRAGEDAVRSRAQAHVNDVKTVSAEWEAKRKSQDPDWSLKQRRVGELVELEVRRKGYPESKADVVKMLDDINKDVTEEYKRFVPKPREVRTAQGSASSGATAEPKTALEAAKMALGRGS